MSTSGGAVSPYQTIQGEAVEPTAIVDPASFAAHDLGSLIKELIHRAGFHTEGEVLRHMNTVDSWERSVVPGKDRRHVVGEDDRASVEDVALRIPPQVGLAPTHQPEKIDYTRLAAAIVAAQAEAALTPAPLAQSGSDNVPVITDVPVSPANGGILG